MVEQNSELAREPQNGGHGFYFCDPDGEEWRCPEVSEKTPYSAEDLENFEASVNKSSSGSRTIGDIAKQQVKTLIRKLMDEREDIGGRAGIVKRDANGKSKAQQLHEYDHAPMAMVYFDSGQSGLSEEAKLILDAVVSEQQVLANELVLLGFTDYVGEEGFNDQLAMDRAKEVEKFMLSQGLQKQNVTAYGDGLCCYLHPNDSEQNRRLNRRVEVHLKSTEFDKP